MHSDHRGSGQVSRGGRDHCASVAMQKRPGPAASPLFFSTSDSVRSFDESAMSLHK